MFEKIRKLKDRKGFTLVELIVVLVILAILAALLIPALTGYIDKANKEKIVSECRMVVMAAQTEASELYGKMDGGKFGFLTLPTQPTNMILLLRICLKQRVNLQLCSMMMELLTLSSIGTAAGLLLILMALIMRPRRLLHLIAILQLRLLRSPKSFTCW